MADNGAKLQRKIIHIDFDAFFAAIEIRDNPSLSGRPIAVGGAPEKRGVVATCSYEARGFGVRSAMASAYARRLCPDLVIIPPRFGAYRAASTIAHSIFHEYTDRIEPLSLDEAYLDVTDSTCCQGSATLIAQEIRQRIADKVGVTASAGVAPNKFLAKIASDWQKPDGMFVITPDQVESFVFELPVTKIHGVGKVTATRLHRKGIKTCGALRQYSRIELVQWFGSFGERLWFLARGIDERPVESDRRRKSLSVEHTYSDDLNSLDDVLAQITPLLEDLERRFARLKGEYKISKRMIKLKFSDFTQTTLEEMLDSTSGESESHYRSMVEKAWQRNRTRQPDMSIRLLGLGVRLFDLREEGHYQQMALFK